MSAPDAAREGELRDIIGCHKAVASGYLRLLSLEALRERMGDKWLTRAKYIQFVTEAAIKRHLQRGQTFYQANDSSYVIVFDFDAEDRAEFICRAISREVIERLLGSSENQDETLAIEMRVAVVASSQVEQGADLAAMLEQTLNASAPKLISSADAPGEHRSTGRAPPRHSAPAAPPRGMGGGERGAEPRADVYLRNLLQQAAQRMGPNGDPRSAAESLAELPGFEIRYLPFWNVGARAFLNYRITPRLHDGVRGSVEIDWMGDDIGDPDLIRDFDRLVLDLATEDLARGIAAGAKYVATVPMHVESVATDADQKALLKYLERQPAAVQQLLILEIADTRNTRFNDLVRYAWMLHGRCRQVMFRQNISNLPWLQSQHLPEGSVAMSVRVSNGAVAEREIVTEMNAFLKAVSSHRIETFAYDLRSRSLAFAAIGSGFNQVSGAAIAGFSKGPVAVASVAMKDLFPALKD